MAELDRLAARVPREYPRTLDLRRHPAPNDPDPLTRWLPSRDRALDRRPDRRYQRYADGFDELVGDDGRVRDHWAGVASTYRTLGVDELARRRDEIRLLLEQDGVTYNVLGRPTSVTPIVDARPDPVGHARATNGSASSGA